MDKVKLAFIGCGGIVRNHLNQGLKDFPDVEFVGWCDLKEEVAAERREQVGGKGATFTDAEKMIRTAKPDAVFIALPTFAHGPTEDLVIANRLPFFIEKPVAIDMATARRVAEGVRANNLIASVGYMNRYREATKKVRALLAAQKPVMLHGGWCGGGPKPDAPIYQWWVRKDKSGGQFTEQTTHTIDLARYLFGDVESVYAVAVRDRVERPDFFTIEDASMVQLRFRNGAAGNLYSSCCTPQGSGVSLTVWGTQLYAEFKGWGHDVTIRQTGAAEPLAIKGGAQEIFAVEDRAFIDAVKTGDRSGILATYEDGLKATAIATAADESMTTGRMVVLEK
jgi:predicted dehydrogenase